jgi:hypothetical protein
MYSLDSNDLSHCFHYRLILNLDPLPTNFEEDTVELFGFQWVTETALVYSCRELFHLFRYVCVYF